MAPPQNSRARDCAARDSATRDSAARKPATRRSRARSAADRARRDLRMLTNNLIGRLGRPYEPRDGARWVASAQETPAPEPQPRETPRPATVTPFPRRAVAADVTVALPSGPVTFHVPAGSTILEAAEAADIALPHSCAVGGCGACLCALSHGSVHVPEDACLTDDERADGLTLPCVGQPTSPVVHLEPF